MTDEEMVSIDRKARQEERDDTTPAQHRRYMKILLSMDSTEARVKRKMEAMLQESPQGRIYD